MTRMELIGKISADADVVVRVLVALHNRQEDLEQATRDTKVRNGIGFMRCDAGKMSELAEKVKAGGTLTDEELAICRRPSIRRGVPRLARYFRQVQEMALFANC